MQLSRMQIINSSRVTRIQTKPLRNIKFAKKALLSTQIPSKATRINFAYGLNKKAAVTGIV